MACPHNHRQLELTSNDTQDTHFGGQSWAFGCSFSCYFQLHGLFIGKPFTWFVRHLVQNLPRSDEKAIRSKHLTFSCYIFPLDIFHILWARQCMKADWAWTFDDQNDWWYIHAYLSTPKWSYCRVCWEISMHIYIWEDLSILTCPLGRGLPNEVWPVRGSNTTIWNWFTNGMGGQGCPPNPKLTFHHIFGP